MIQFNFLTRLFKNNKETKSTSIYDNPIKFKTVQPDVSLSFEAWCKKYKVGKSFTLLEDSDWLRKVRKLNHIKSVETEQPVYLIKNPWS